MNTQRLKFVTIARVVLGTIFAGAALNYFWRKAFGWPLLPVPMTDRGSQFALSIIRVGYLWPLMKWVRALQPFGAGMTCHAGALRERDSS
jgi:hypothetical protein